MKANDWLVAAQQTLTTADVQTARLDALVLLEDAVGKDRAYILSHPELELPAAALAELESKLKRREQHVPLAYIRGFSEFYGRKFYVNEQVLEPRPESEAMIELLRQLAPADAVIADIGCGSGALGITAALELPVREVIAVDIDPRCLEVTVRNAKLHAVSLALHTGDLLQPLIAASAQPTVLLCNLPYVPDNYAINTAASHEPALALFGGQDGLDVYRQLFAQTALFAKKPSLVLAESLPNQHAALEAIAFQQGYALHKTEDFIQAFVAD